MAGDRATSETPKYLIGAVTKLTGLSIDVVRVWERRYGAVRPARSEGGTRLYSDADVSRLRRLRQAVENGYSIGQAARLSEGELDELIADVAPSSAELQPFRAVVDRFIEAVQRLDVIAADQELARAATLFPAHELIKEIIAPAIDEVAELRSSKAFDLAHERLAIELMRRTLGSLFRFYPPSENAESAVFAAPSDERNELTLSLAALLAATHGWRVVYLGADLPAAEIALAVRLANAQALVLAVQTHSVRVEGELEALSRLLPASTRVWITGPGAVRCGMLVQRAGWGLARDLDQLDDRLKR